MDKYIIIIIFLSFLTAWTRHLVGYVYIGGLSNVHNFLNMKLKYNSHFFNY